MSDKPKKEKYSLTDQEIIDKHFRVLDKLSKLCVFYDNGELSIAEEIAVKLRLLLHDTPRQKSLVGQVLKILGKELPNSFFFSASNEYDPKNIADHTPLISFQFNAGKSATYSPISQPFTFQSKVLYPKWWDEQLIFCNNKELKLTRKDVILNLADTDGGAHVDPELSKDYYQLTRKDSLGFSFCFSNDPKTKFSLGNPVLPTVRTIANEVLITLNPENDISELPII